MNLSQVFFPTGTAGAEVVPAEAAGRVRGLLGANLIMVGYRAAFFFFLLIVVICAGRATPSLLVKQKGVPHQEQPKNPNVSSKLTLETSAKQVLLIDYTTGVILLEKNADELMHPSSMTKIMTAYVIFESLEEGHIQMTSSFPVSERAWRMGGSKMFVPLNAMVTVEDLLKGIIIQSGNDACIVIAEGLEGSEENFAHLMTQKAQEMGAMHTTFKNASGWPDQDHLTTARDLVIISRRLIHDFPEFYALFSEKEFFYNTIRQGNRNSLLYKNIGCDGIKTGHTDSGGYGVVVSAVQDGRRLLLVINGLSSEKTRAKEALKLMTWAFQTFNNYELFKAEEQIDVIPVWLGEENTVPATVLEDVVVTLPRLSRKGLKVDIQYDTLITAPIEKGAVIGKMRLSLPSQKQPLEIPLVASKSIGKAGFFKKIRDSFSYLIWGKF